MKCLKTYISLLRVKHYIKNFLIFFPILFSGNLLNFDAVILAIIEFFSFSFAASAIYVFNDLLDYEKDKNHPIKRNRPIASGIVKKSKAKIIFGFLVLIVTLIQILLYTTKLLNFDNFISSTMIIYIYIIINIIYSIYMKHLPILDIIFLTLGFVLRVYFGGSFINVKISNWLYLTILSFSLYLVLGKRKGELQKNNDLSRKVLKFYNESYLDKFMQIYLSLTLVFYSLWCMNFENNLLLYSIFIIIFIVMKYSLDVDSNSIYLGDPVETLLHDKTLIISILLYVLYLGVILYGKNIFI